MSEKDLFYIIVDFYGDQYHGRPMRPNADGNGPFLALLGRLHERVFPDYLFDPEQVLAQGAAQLRGNSGVVENYLPVRFRFPPLSGTGKALVLFSGIHDGGFGFWAEDPEVNQRLQGVLREMEKEGDTIS